MEPRPRTARMELEILLDRDPIEGRIESLPAGGERTFMGWVALAGAIEEEIAEARSLSPEPPADGPAAPP